jgi:hypothetical protein
MHNNRKVAIGGEESNSSSELYIQELLHHLVLYRGQFSTLHKIHYKAMLMSCMPSFFSISILSNVAQMNCIYVK